MKQLSLLSMFESGDAATVALPRKVEPVDMHYVVYKINDMEVGHQCVPTRAKADAFANDRIRVGHKAEIYTWDDYWAKFKAGEFQLGRAR